jgi:hypothetical protein
MTEINEEKPQSIKPPEKGYGLFDLILIAFSDIPGLMRTLKFAVWMIIILSLFTLAGTILPQQQFADPHAFSREYASLFHVDPNDGTRTFGEFIYYNLVVPLQLYRIFETPLYLVLMLLLTISSALCAWDRLIITKKLLSKTEPKSNPAQIRAMPYKTEGALELGFDDAAPRIRTALKSRHFQLFETAGDENSLWIFGRKNSFKYYAAVAMHFAFLFILLGGIIRLPAVAGYEGTITLAESDSSLLGSDVHGAENAEKAGTAYTPKSPDRIQLEEYTSIYREREFGGIDPETGMPMEYKGMPSDYVSKLKVYVSDQPGIPPLVEKSIEVNKPLTFGGVSYYQLSVMSKLTFSIEIPGQMPQTVEAYVNQPFEVPGLSVPVQCTIQSWDIAGGIWEKTDGTQTELPYVVRLVDYSMAGSPQQPVLLGYVSESKPLSVEGIGITLENVKEYSSLQYVHDPGLPLVGLGGLLLALGMTIALYFPYKTVRLMLRKKGSESEYMIGSNYRGIPDEVAASIRAPLTK